jgi:hypothetical protein
VRLESFVRMERHYRDRRLRESAGRSCG